MPSTDQRVGWGSIVRARRESLEMTQQHLADAAGVSLKTITNLETGATVPQEGKLQAVREALDLPDDKAESLSLMAADQRSGRLAVTGDERYAVVFRESLLGYIEQAYGDDVAALYGLIRDLLYAMSPAQVVDVLGPRAQVRTERRD